MIFNNTNHKVCTLNKTGANVDHTGAELLANIFALAFVNTMSLNAEQNWS